MEGVIFLKKQLSDRFISTAKFALKTKNRREAGFNLIFPIFIRMYISIPFASSKYYL